MKNKLEFLKLIKELSYEKRLVTLASGKQSDFYINMKNTLLHPKGAVLAGQLIFEIIQKQIPEIKGVGGVPVGADPIVTSTGIYSLQMQKPLMGFYIRKELKDHGTKDWIEGSKNLNFNENYCLLEDVVTSGGSSLKAYAKAKEAQLNIIAIITCVDREEGGRENIEKAGLRFFSITTKSEIINMK